MLERLEPFVGEWTIEAAFRDAPPTGAAGRVVFEWALGEAFLLERFEVSHPDAPDGLCVIAADPEGGGLHPALLRLARRRARLRDDHGREGLDARGAPSLISRRWTSRSAMSAPSATTARSRRAPGRSPTTARTGSSTSA